MIKAQGDVAMEPVGKYAALVKNLRHYGLGNGSALGRHMGIMDEAADALEEAESTMSRMAEHKFLLNYAKGSCFDNDICRDRLRMLWTAYCLHHDLEVDTSGYDNDLLVLWGDGVCNNGDGGEPETADWSDYDSFDDFMCAYLV